MPLHAEDLPKALRDKLGLTTKGSSKKSRAGVGEAAPCPGHCACGEPFDRYTAWVRHSKETGCHRWSIDVPLTATDARGSVRHHK